MFPQVEFSPSIINPETAPIPLETSRGRNRLLPDLSSLSKYSKAQLVRSALATGAVGLVLSSSLFLLANRPVDNAIASPAPITESIESVPSSNLVESVKTPEVSSFAKFVLPKLPVEQEEIFMDKVQKRIEFYNREDWIKDTMKWEATVDKIVNQLLNNPHINLPPEDRQILTPDLFKKYLLSTILIESQGKEDAKAPINEDGEIPEGLMQIKSSVAIDIAKSIYLPDGRTLAERGFDLSNAEDNLLIGGRLALKDFYTYGREWGLMYAAHNLGGKLVNSGIITAQAKLENRAVPEVRKDFAKENSDGQSDPATRKSVLENKISYAMLIINPATSAAIKVSSAIPLSENDLNGPMSIYATTAILFPEEFKNTPLAKTPQATSIQTRNS